MKTSDLVLEGQSLLIDDLRDADVTHTARCFAQGIIALLAQRWDVLLLDHDLADFSGRDDTEMTGYNIACWLEELPQYLPARIIIVSDNSVGRQKIMQALGRFYPHRSDRVLSGRRI